MRQLQWFYHPDRLIWPIDPDKLFKIYSWMSSTRWCRQTSSNIVVVSFPGGVRHLSRSLWRLSHLTALYINNNHLTALPPDIARLHRLEYLNLSCNQLCTLPSEIGTIVSLRYDPILPSIHALYNSTVPNIHLYIYMMSAIFYPLLDRLYFKQPNLNPVLKNV